MQVSVELEPFSRFAAKPLPKVDWMIRPLFEKDSLAILYGPSGEYKSFVAMSWAFHLATGRDWLLPDYRIRKRHRVLYCAGEGERGVRRRGAALAQFHGIAPEDVGDYLQLYPAAPNFRDKEAFKRFMSQVASYQPEMIFIDTLARSFVGGDENAAKDMGEWVHTAAALQKATQACVMAIHHTPKANKQGQIPAERGNGALRAALDTSIRCSAVNGIITLSSVKQKDEGKFPDIHLQVEPIVVQEPDDPEELPLTSLVVVPVEAPLELEPSVDVLLDVLTDAGTPLTIPQWRELVDALKLTKPIPQATFYRWVTKLVKQGILKENDASQYVLVGTP